MGTAISKLFDRIRRNRFDVEATALKTHSRSFFMVGTDPTYFLNFRGDLVRAIISRSIEVIACVANEKPAIRNHIADLGARVVTYPIERTGLNPMHDLRTVAALISLLRQHQPGMLLA